MARFDLTPAEKLAYSLTDCNLGKGVTMNRQSNTPSDVPVIPRNREHHIADALTRDWYDNHPFKTAWYNSMSITFPLGEKFFIDSVRAFSDQVTDPKLQEEIRGFCGQEGFHRREHDRYNRTLCQLRGYDLQYLEGRLAKKLAFTVGTAHMLRRDGKVWSPRLWLQGCRFLFGKNGVYRRVWPAYREWFKDGFHPWQRDTRALLSNWEQAQAPAT